MQTYVEARDSSTTFIFCSLQASDGWLEVPSLPSPPNSYFTHPVLPAGPCSSHHHLYVDIRDIGSPLIPEFMGASLLSIVRPPAHLST